MDLTRHSFENHISSKMNESLEDLFNHVLEMGGLVEKQLDSAVVALQQHDAALAKEVVLLDKAVNRAEKQIDKMCARVLVRQQPAAADLRLVISAIRIAVDLERMGDEVVKMAKLVINFEQQYAAVCEGTQGIRGLLAIASMSKGMLKTSLDAFARVSSENTLEVIEQEEAIDELYDETMTELKAALVHKTAAEVECLLEVIFALRACERFSDHARNMAESIIYLVKGQDVRDLDLGALNTLLVDQ